MRDRGTTSGTGRTVTLIALGGRANASGRLDCDLPADPESARMARTRVRKRFAGVMADDAVSDLELVVTELVTNAIAASAVGQRVGLRFERAAGTVLIEVFDSCPDPPLLGDANKLALSGRGLALVKDLSDDFGWQLDSAGLGKVVWALCPAPGITS